MLTCFSNIRKLRESVVGDVNNAIDSGSEDVIHDGRKINTMRLSSSGVTLTKAVNRRKGRNYDDEDEDDVTLTASLNKDMKLLQSSRTKDSRDSYGTASSYNDQEEKKGGVEYDSKGRIVQLGYSSQDYKQNDSNNDYEDDDNDDVYASSRSRNMAMRGSNNTNRTASSKNSLDDTNDVSEFSSRVSNGKMRLGTAMEDSGEQPSFYDGGSTQTFSFTDDSLFDPKTHQVFDLEKTVDTDISLPLNADSEVRQRADKYERVAKFSSNISTPPLSARTDRNAPSSASPFDNMVSEFDDAGSLALSESNDDGFVDLDNSSRSLKDRY